MRMEVLKCMLLLVTGFSKLAAPHIGPALSAAWQVRWAAIHRPINIDLQRCSSQLCWELPGRCWAGLGA